MQIGPALFPVIIAAQSFLMGALLLAVAAGRTGPASKAVALRGFAMLLQGVGFVLIARRGHIGDLWGFVASFGFVITGHAMTLVGLRMLLGLRQFRGLVASMLALAWVLMLWPGWLMPDRAASATLAALYSIAYAIAVAWPLVARLRLHASPGERTLLGTALFMLATQAWLLVAPSMAVSPSTSLSVVLLLGALMPTLTGAAFLMMLYESIEADRRGRA